MFITYLHKTQNNIRLDSLQTLVKISIYYPYFYHTIFHTLICSLPCTTNGMHYAYHSLRTSNREY